MEAGILGHGAMEQPIVLAMEQPIVTNGQGKRYSYFIKCYSLLQLLCFMKLF